MIVVEQNLDMVKTSDWLIDIRAEGGFGENGLLRRAPKDVNAVAESPIDRFLMH